MDLFGLAPFLFFCVLDCLLLSCDLPLVIRLLLSSHDGSEFVLLLNRCSVLTFTLVRDGFRLLGLLLKLSQELVIAIGNQIEAAGLAVNLDEGLNVLENVSLVLSESLDQLDSVW